MAASVAVAATAPRPRILPLLPVVLYDEAEQLCDCEGCPLGGATRLPKGAVLGRGPADAELIVVGEAPGWEEVRRGRPFQGRSGQLLWRVLQRRGLTASKVYTTNALMCMPAEGKPSMAKAVGACNERLRAELRALPARRVILAVGAVAATALRGDKATITELNGRVEWSDEWGCWLAYAYHPAYVLRNPNVAAHFQWAVMRAVEDMTLAREDAPRPLPVTWDCLETVDAARRYLLGLLAELPAKIVCDLETTGLDPRVDDILELGLAHDPNHATIVVGALLEVPAVRELLTSLFARTDTKWIYHNGKFDTAFLRLAGFPARIDIDTMLLHFCLDEGGGGGGESGRGGHGLKRIAPHYLGVPQWEEGIDGSRMAEVPAAERHQYQAYDCCYTLQLESVLTEQLEKEPASRNGWMAPLDTHNKLLIPAANALTAIELRGIRIDRPRLAELRTQYISLATAERERAATLGGVGADEDFNPASWIQVGKILYAPRTKWGWAYPNLLHTDKATLHSLQRLDSDAERAPNQFIESVLSYRSLVHTRTTYLDGIERRLDRDGFIHTSILLHGPVTGRTSSRGPNLQNLPKDSVVKELFVARPGRVLCEADYKQLEVRVLAWLSRDAALFASLRSADYHWSVANATFPRIVRAMGVALETGLIVTLEEVCRLNTLFADFWRRQDGPDRTDDIYELYGWMKTRLRRQAKYVTFGNMYGEGPEALASAEKGMGVTVEEATEFKENWRRTYPAAARYLDGEARAARSDGWVESATGRRRRFHGSKLGLQVNVSNEAMNHGIQALASDIDLMSAVRLERMLPEANGLGDVLMLVHDSVLFEIDAARREDATALIREVMTTVVVDPEVVFDVDIATGPNWAACH